METKEYEEIQLLELGEDGSFTQSHLAKATVPLDETAKGPLTLRWQAPWGGFPPQPPEGRRMRMLAQPERESVREKAGPSLAEMQEVPVGCGRGAWAVLNLPPRYFASKLGRSGARTQH